MLQPRKSFPGVALSWWLPALAAGLGGCSSCDHAEPEPPRPELTSHGRNAKPMSSALKGAAASGFRQRLEEEAKNRPEAKLEAEDILAAIEKDGTPLDRKRQQMASPHFARFCMSAHAGQKVQLTACEHESEERANEHVQSTQKLERPERRIGKNGLTTLLVRRDLNSDVEAPVVDKIMHAYERIDQNGDAN